MSAAIVYSTALLASYAALAFPFGDSSPKLDSRDAAFAPIVIPPLEGGVQWGVPLDGGPLRVLFIAPRFALRDAAELAHRLEMRAEVVPLWDATHLGRPDAYPRKIPGTSHDEVVHDLLDKLDRKLDAIVAANFDFSVLPPEVFQVLADRVRGGTGLVLAHHRHTLPDSLKAFLDEFAPDESGAIVTTGLGAERTAEWTSGLGFVQCGRIGQGRVVEIDYQGEWPLAHCLIPALANPLLAEQEDFDTYLSLAARAVRWAGGRDVPVAIAGVSAKPAPGPEEIQIPPGLEEMVDANLPTGATILHPFQLQLAAPADKTYVVRAGVRQRGRNQPPITITPKRDALRKGSQTHDFVVVAGAGEYWLDIWLLDGDKVAEWYSEVVTIDSWPSIADLALSKSFVLPQDSIGITFTMPARQRPCLAMARATDPLGRIVAERHQPIPPETALVQLGLGFADLIGDMVKVEVFVSDRDAVVMSEWDARNCAYAYKHLPVRGPNPTDRFDVVADVSGGVEFNARANIRSLAAQGFGAVSFPATEESLRVMTSLGLRVVPQITSYLPYHSPPAEVRAPCINNPEFIASEQTYLKGMAQLVRDYPTAAVSLGEGNCLSAAREDLCRCTHCLAGFAEYLNKTYAGLDALNRAWGTSHESFAAAAPATAQQARDNKRYAPWIDFRLFMDASFARTHVSARGAVRMADMRSRTGLVARAADELYSGYDWSALASQLDMLATPAGLRAIEIARASRPASGIGGIQLPADLSPETLRWLPWYALLHRAHSIWWPDVTASTAAVPAMAAVDPFGDVAPFAPEFFGESTALQGGLARLWLKSAPSKADIAIYTSRTSAWLNEVDNQFGVSSAETEGAFASALSALGYAYDFVPAHRVEKAGFAGYRVLILPMARALSDAEVAAIRSFAAAGGCVIADIAPGAFNEHGVPRESPPLADTFGIRYANASRAAPPANALAELKIDGHKVSGDFADVRADEGVEPAGAQTGGLANTTPVWLLRSEQPLSLLINHSVNAPALDRARGMLDEVLRSAGATRTVEFESRRGRVFQGERFAAAYGNAALVALLANRDTTDELQKVKLKFDRSAHVYDLRAGMKVLRPAKVEAELVRGGAALYSALPYEIVSCTLTAPPSVQAGARAPLHIALDTGKATPGDHLVRIDVFAVTTETLVPLPHYGQEIVCEKGEGDAYVPFALNDPATRYRIVARDLLTGVSGEALVNLTVGRLH
ncbi:MAG: beta-galactosidase trimerization domain-containing protein [Candidatus Hydrogenedentes bacterium]|nr:beta-galactosidase trimerization domain-containing protein [Candidatus Hydrogenedentota bacterium]